MVLNCVGWPLIGLLSERDHAVHPVLEQPLEAPRQKPRLGVARAGIVEHEPRQLERSVYGSRRPPANG